MTEPNTDQAEKKEEIPAEKKAGFFGRMFQRLDDSMKQKADEKSAEADCCGGSDGKCC